MALLTLKINKMELLRLYFRLSQTQVVGGRLAQIIAFMKRLLKVWPELAPGESEVIAKAIPEDERRDVAFTPEEQSAVADAMLRLLNSDKITAADGSLVESTVGIKLEIMKDVALMGSPLLRHVETRLAREAVEPFIEPIDENPDGSAPTIDKLT